MLKNQDPGNGQSSPILLVFYPYNRILPTSLICNNMVPACSVNAIIIGFGMLLVPLWNKGISPPDRLAHWNGTERHLHAWSCPEWGGVDLAHCLHNRLSALHHPPWWFHHPTPLNPPLLDVQARDGRGGRARTTALELDWRKKANGGKLGANDTPEP